MKKTSVILLVISGLVVLTGWAITQYYFQSSAAIGPEPVPVIISSPPANKAANSLPEPKDSLSESKEAEPASGTQVSKETSTPSQHVAVDKVFTMDAEPPNLADYNYSIKKDEKKGVEIIPGVTVGNKAVEVKLDKASDRSLEIERNPSNSNNQYQVMWKSKY
ncbi:MAG TPA: hypothetical protein PKA28_05455 [Methylomusa anaerophila]|uniref:Uncharacterized protein n=1 Tax=Methylomusa anaerophila TaxID=1930071 RepID=A0A348AM10_9FIRM|nr:hypothetical protein [Methylomusa anaerophila]BBB92108.1 hypothetical protein MAMMFC1_02793 [Methylomusa anaerophila]HML87878.1 hypothetical protein [Methylomusa anaerophila]